MNSRAENKAGRKSAFTLAETVVSIAIGGLVVAGVVSGYTWTLRRAEWSAHSLAANSLAQQRLEQTRAAKWDTLASPPVDQLVASNFPPTIEVLDIPVSGTNVVLATNITSITVISTDPPLKSIQVDCVRAFHNGRVFTNSIATMRAPDQ
jgi:type II secretory pathway pseudopilin PulG